MKKRNIAVLLLAWLFSQQLFAAVWMVASTDANCASNTQSDCVVQSIKHIGHNMPIVTVSTEIYSVGTSSDEVNSQEQNKAQNNLSSSCDHCRASCQPSVLSSNLVTPFNTIHLLFDAHVIDAVVDTFLSSLFRPPILA